MLKLRGSRVYVVRKVEDHRAVETPLFSLLQEWWHHQFHDFNDAAMACHPAHAKHYCVRCGRHYESGLLQPLEEIRPPRLTVDREGNRVANQPGVEGY